MKRYWENEDPSKGDVIAVIDLEDGSGVQKFKGASKDEVAEKLLDAQANASRKIRDQARSLQPVHAQPSRRTQPRMLTADERFAMAVDVTDPTKLPEVIAKVVEAATGVSLAETGKRARDEEDREIAEQARKDGIDFARETTDYISCKHNAETIAEYLQLHRLPPIKQNYAYAWEQLKGTGLVQVKQEENGDEGALPRVATRARIADSSTGLRSAHSTSGPDTTRATPGRYTMDQIEAMPAGMYGEKIRGEAGFAALVDQLYAQQRRSGA